MKITRKDGSLFIQECDVARIMFGSAEELNGKAPDALYAELSRHAAWTEAGPMQIVVPPEPAQSFRFCYHFSDPEAVEWLNQQKWLLELRPLMRLGSRRLARCARNLEQSANEARFLLVTQGSEFSPEETRNLRQLAERLVYKASSMRMVLGYLDGHWALERPLPEELNRSDASGNAATLPWPTAEALAVRTLA